MRTKCPKKTIISSKEALCRNTSCWSRRNDSKNMGALLHLESPTTDDESEDDDDDSNSRLCFKKSRNFSSNRNCQAFSPKKSRYITSKTEGCEKVFRKCLQTQKDCQETHKTCKEKSYKQTPRKSWNETHRSCNETPRYNQKPHRNYTESREDFSHRKGSTPRYQEDFHGLRRSKVCKENCTNCPEPSGGSHMCCKVFSQEKSCNVDCKCSSCSCQKVKNKINCLISGDDSDLDQTPRRLLLFSKSEPPHKICRRGCRSCYCNQTPIQPLLKCDNDVEHCDCHKVECVKPRLSPRCENSEVHSVFLKCSPESRRRVFDQFTKRRRNYENCSASYFLDLKKQLAKLEEEMGECEDTDSKDCGEMEERKSSQEIKCSKTSFASLRQELLDFRDTNYFECHSSTSLMKPPVTTHSCQHDFTINDKFQPVPKNPDAYGISRCRICSKPSYESIANFSYCNSNSNSSSSLLRFPSRGASRFSVDRDEDVSSCGSEKSVKMLVYNLGDECYNIEVSQEFYKDLESNLKVPAYKKPLPSNSMALRFQKGVS